ncbi:hypothetical protein [Mycobacterium tuberculosis]|uniref:hypothetical protein n=1 Tax=Mycobacterium tuberculosis TaxID=1773 RepID=UPI0039C2CF10
MNFQVWPGMAALTCDRPPGDIAGEFLARQTFPIGLSPGGIFGEFPGLARDGRTDAVGDDPGGGGEAFPGGLVGAFVAHAVDELDLLLVGQAP